MAIPVYSTISIIFGSLGAVVGLAMLLLVLWHGSRQLENILMALYMFFVAVWGAAVAWQHIAAIIGASSTFWILINAYAITLAAPTLFGLTAAYLGLWEKRPWTKQFTLIGLLILLLDGIPLFSGRLITDPHINEIGETIYNITTLGYIVFTFFYIYYLAALITLLETHKHHSRYFFAAGLIVSIGTLSTLFPITFLRSFPIAVTSATIAALLFAYSILQENIFNPLIKLNQDLEITNKQLSSLTKVAQENEANLRSLLENTTDLVWSIDTKYQIQTINTTASDFFALIYEHPLNAGDYILSYIPEQERENWQTLYDRALNGERFSVEQQFVIGASKTTVAVETSFNPIYNKEHHVDGVSIFARDITKRKESEQQLKLQALTFENLSESVIITNLDGYITDCNSATETIFGYSTDELIGQMPEIWHDTSVTGVLTHRILSGLERDGRWEGEIRFIRKDGKRGICEALVLPLFDDNGKRIAALGVSRDVTKERQHEKELQEAKEAAEAANRAKSSFLASMSHELRTPLNAIIGYGEMLEDIAIENGYTDIAPDLKRITTAGQHLLALINEVLDLSKIEAGKVNLYLEEFALSDLIDDVVSSSYKLIETNNNQFTLELDEELGIVYTDAVKMRQILLNLLSNAAKFTHDGSITLKVERQPAAPDDVIIIQVIDTGIGMSKQEASLIFNAFTQADESTTRRYGGTGLGLTISHRFCQLMGGTIAVESEPGQGSTFIVRLPARIQPLSQSPLTRSGYSITDSSDSGTTIIRPAPTKGIVLVIHPQPVEREKIVRWLYQDGYRVYAADSKNSGFNLAVKLQPLAILISDELPNKGISTFIETVKNQNELQGIPLVGLLDKDADTADYESQLSQTVFKPTERLKLLQAIYQSIYDSAETSAKPKHILIVEDNFALRDIMRLTLEKRGYFVHPAADSLTALEFLQDFNSQPAIILLDLMLPEVDGFEFIERIKRMPHTADIPIIVVTAKQLTEDELNRLEYNVAHILHKGFYDNSELLNQVSYLIEQHTADDKRRETA